MTTIDGSDIIEILDEFTQEGLTAFHQNQVLLSALESRDEDLVRNQSLIAQMDEKLGAAQVESANLAARLVQTQKEGFLRLSSIVESCKFTQKIDEQAVRLAGERQNVINAQKDKQRVMVEVEHLRRKLQSLQKELQDAKRKSDETMKMAHRADVGNSTLDWYKSKLEEAKSEIEGLKKKLKGREDGEFDDREEAAGGRFAKKNKRDNKPKDSGSFAFNDE